MKLPAGDLENEGPNLTPIIDVVFLLLIFFLVATRLDKEEKERQLPITLPEVVEALPLSSTKQLVIDVTEKGKFMIRDQEYNEDQLLERLQAEKDVNPDRKVLIYGHADSAWRYGVQVMSVCNKAKIKDYQVAAIEKQGSLP